MTSTPNAKTNHDLGSERASLSWPTEKFVLSPPSRSWTMRRDKTSFCRASRNHASLGPLGMRMKKTTPAAEVRAPQMRNSTLQGARVKDVFFPIPYMSKQPMTCATPFMDIQSL